MALTIMFDKYTQFHNTPVNTTVTITEKRAPTDESVKLLREMEASAAASVLNSVRLENCELDIVLHHMRDQFALDLLIAINYRLGGTRVTLYHTVRDLGEPRTVLNERISRELVAILSNSIAVNMLKSVSPTTMKQLFQSNTL